jgi:hypothetical protein
MHNDLVTTVDLRDGVGWGGVGWGWAGGGGGGNAKTDFPRLTLED